MTEARTSQYWKAVWGLVLATVCWGFSFPLMKALVLVQQKLRPDASVWFITSQTLAVRFAVATLGMWLICRGRMRGLTRKEIKLGVGLGVFAGVGTIFQMAGLEMTLASTSAFLTQFYVLILPLVVAAQLRRWPSLLLCVFSLLVFVGMGVLCGVDWRNLGIGRGEALTLLAAGGIFWHGQTTGLVGDVRNDCRHVRADGRGVEAGGV